MAPGRAGRGPWLVLGLVSTLAVTAIGYVHYDQQKQRTDMRRLIVEEKEREREEQARAGSQRARAGAPGAKGGPGRSL
ncbi:hypothetical protein Naga_100736g3 [Nannochloropsis gaditana]|uniref:Uncharacterized protein n=1 Tax=Nannochloropsis gaditana TaxID=72520 RepID=W7T0G5_9STRA|nr:hypothetical protein Naga_100736g3 [Nannochloropsis gaditana]